MNDHHVTYVIGSNLNNCLSISYNRVDIGMEYWTIYPLTSNSGSNE